MKLPCAPVLSLWKSLLLLRRSIQGRTDDTYEPVILGEGTAHLEADFFRPPHGPSPGLILLVHGLTRQGRKEPRIRRFAQALRSVGYHVLVPTFPKARQLVLDSDMAEEIERWTLFLRQQVPADSSAIGIFGVSYGGTMALRAIARPTFQPPIDWIATLGAFLSLKDLYVYARTGTYERDPAFSLTPDVETVRYFQDLFADPTRPLSDVLQSQDPFFTQFSLTLDLNFPAKTKILLLHSKYDTVVPWPEILRIRDLLETQGLSVRTRVLPLSAHAHLRPWNLNFRVLRATNDLLQLGSAPRGQNRE